NLGKMIQEVLDGRIGVATIVLVPIADGDQERTRQGELGYAVSVRHEKPGILDKDRLRGRHSPYDDFGVLDFALVRKPPAGLVAAHTRQKLTNILRPPPFPVADYVQANLLLQPDREDHEIVERLPEALIR